MVAPVKDTFAQVRAESTRVEPIRFATRVLAAMERGKGIWKVMLARVERTDWAASSSVPRYEDARVRISNARHSASTMMRPGRASWIIGSQFVNARFERPFQHSEPAIK